MVGGLLNPLKSKRDLEEEVAIPRRAVYCGKKIPLMVESPFTYLAA